MDKWRAKQRQSVNWKFSPPFISDLSSEEGTSSGSGGSRQNRNWLNWLSDELLLSDDGAADEVDVVVVAPVVVEVFAKAVFVDELVK